MSSTINAATSGGLISTGDTSGQLQLQTAGTTALSISSGQVVTLTNALPIASGGTGSTTLAGANIATTNSSTQSINSANTFGFKNRIINGGMVIDQRNAGASGTAAGYTLDRWTFGLSQSSKLTWGQNLGSVTPPAGFTKYLGVTSSSAYSVVASDYFFFQQFVEGYNMADLAWGTASAKTVTLSFQVYSSLTGTFGGALQNGNASPTYSYPFTYSIPVANTWTTISVTVAGPTAGTWTNLTNGQGLTLDFGLGVGSTYSGTAGSWATQNVVSATGATSVVGTSGATLYITGVQLEVGTQATSFDFRDYGRELMMCQRYYYRNTNSTNTAIATLANYNTTNAYGGVSLLQAMRVAPTSSYSSLAHFTYYTTGVPYTLVTLQSGAGQGAGPTTSEILIQTGSSWTAGNSGWLRITNANGWIDYSAEL